MNPRLLPSLLIILMFLFVEIPCSAQALRYEMNENVNSSDASFYGPGSVADYPLFIGRQSNIQPAGDVNGDGLEDILIGNPGEDVGKSDSGRASLIFGKTSGWHRVTNISSADVTIRGTDNVVLMGEALTGVGDLDGDGYGDFIVSALDMTQEFARRKPLKPGEAYQALDGDRVHILLLFYGHPNPWPSELVLSDADAVFKENASYSDYSRPALTDAGDLNSDGFSDFAVGIYGYVRTSYNNSYNDSGGGSLFIFRGGRTRWSGVLDLAQSSHDLLYGDISYESGFANWVEGVGDVNGDGFDDLMVSTYGTSSRDFMGVYDSVILIFGQFSGWGKNVSVFPAIDASFTRSRNTGGRFSVPISGVGDVNRDGFDDIMIGLPDETIYRDEYTDVTMNGVAYLQFGKASGWTRNASFEDSAVRFITGKYNSDDTGIGRTFGGQGDLNGDGYDDIVIGAPFMSYKDMHGVGKVYVFLGHGGEWPGTMLTSMADASFRGNGDSECLGEALAIVRDVNGDGNDDLMMGSSETYMKDGNYWVGLTDRDQFGSVAYLMFLEKNVAPDPVNRIVAFSDKDFKNEVDSITVNQTVYIELIGKDQKPTTVDIANIGLSSDISSPLGFRYQLIETAPDTGTFRGSFKVMTNGNRENGWLKAAYGENVVIASLDHPDVRLVLPVTNIMIFPTSEPRAVSPGETYEVQYHTIGNEATTWSLSTGSSWLTWDNGTKVLRGTPSEADMGSYNVKLRVEDSFGNSDAHDFDIVVNHRPMVKILSPSDGQVLSLEDAKNVQLKGSVSDEDEGDVLTFEWLDDGITVGNSLMSVISLGEGTHRMTLRVFDGHRVIEDDIEVRVEAPESKAPLVQALSPSQSLATGVVSLMAISLALITLLAASETFRFKAILAMAPLYSKIKKDAVLDNFTRGKIYQYIVDNPGTHYAKILKELDLNNGTLAFHLQKLEREGFIISKKRGFKHHLFSSNHAIKAPPSIIEQLAASIRACPGISQKELSEELELSRSTVNDHIQRMQQINLVRVERVGKQTKCYMVNEMSDDWAHVDGAE